MIFILSFAVFGASGIQRPFPKVQDFFFGGGPCSKMVFLLITIFPFLFSGQGILLKGILIIVTATGH